MSWLDRLLPPIPAMPAPMDWLQPQIWADDPNHLEQVQLPYDLFGLAPRRLTRRQAIAVPAVARARHLTCGTIARLPLIVLAGETRLDPLPSWCQATDGQTGTLTGEESRRLGIGPQSPWQRMIWTVDDLLFHGRCLWAATELDADQRPLRLARVPIGQWDLDPDTAAVTDPDGQPYPLPCVLIEGPHEGILAIGSESIARAHELEESAAEIARTPFRLELHQKAGDPLSDAEIGALVKKARAALRKNHGVLFTNAALETKIHKIDSSALLIAARNADAVDIARHVSMPAAMLDATSAGASLEYETLAGRNDQWIDYGLSLYTAAIEARLGMDDVVPRGQRVAFDVSTLTDPDPATTGTPTED